MTVHAVNVSALPLLGPERELRRTPYLGVELGEKLTGGCVRIQLASRHPSGEGWQRRTVAQCSNAFAQRAKRDRLDLGGGPRLAPAHQLVVGLQPGPVLGDRGHDVVDA